MTIHQGMITLHCKRHGEKEARTGHIILGMSSTKKQDTLILNVPNAFTYSVLGKYEFYYCFSFPYTFLTDTKLFSCLGKICKDHGTILKILIDS